MKYNKWLEEFFKKESIYIEICDESIFFDLTFEEDTQQGSLISMACIYGNNILTILTPIGKVVFMKDDIETMNNIFGFFHGLNNRFQGEGRWLISPENFMVFYKTSLRLSEMSDKKFHDYIKDILYFHSKSIFFIFNEVMMVIYGNIGDAEESVNEVIVKLCDNREVKKKNMPVKIYEYELNKDNFIKEN